MACNLEKLRKRSRYSGEDEKDPIGHGGNTTS